MQDTTKARPKSPGRRVTDLNQVTLQQKLRENVKAVSTASGCILKICRVTDEIPMSLFGFGFGTET